jgi:hypothetical protein
MFAVSLALNLVWSRFKSLAATGHSYFGDNTQRHNAEKETIVETAREGSTDKKIEWNYDARRHDSQQVNQTAHFGGSADVRLTV